MNLLAFQEYRRYVCSCVRLNVTKAWERGSVGSGQFEYEESKQPYIFRVVLVRGLLVCSILKDDVLWNVETLTRDLVK
jgi:hypothetical protein